MRLCTELSHTNLNGRASALPIFFIMKVTAEKTVKTRHGFFKRGKVYELNKSIVTDINETRLRSGKRALFIEGRQTKEHKPAYEIEQKGSWFTVYEDGVEVDKFQGKDGLKRWV